MQEKEDLHLAQHEFISIDVNLQPFHLLATSHKTIAKMSVLHPTEAPEMIKLTAHPHSGEEGAQVNSCVGKRDGGLAALGIRKPRLDRP